MMTRHPRWVEKRLLAVVFLCAVSALSACSPPKNATVRLPSGADAPEATDSIFLADLASHVGATGGSARVACLVRFVESADPPRRDDVGILHQMENDTWILWGTADAILELARDPSLDWIAEYKPEYKYNSTLAGASVVWVYVEPFLGEQSEYYDDLVRIGIEDLRYINAPGYYYLKATGNQIVELASLWWVKTIDRAHRRVMLH
jgi:hypothetical protein